MDAVLFDWRGTLVVDPSDEWWVTRALREVGRPAGRDEIERLVRDLQLASESPDIVAGRATEDCDPKWHRELSLRWFNLAGLDDQLALALYQLDFLPECHPFCRDVPALLRALHAEGVRVAVVSDIHFDLRPEFAAVGLSDYVDAFVLSYEHGVQKPDPHIFELALDKLEVTPDRALRVGDRPAIDGGAVAVGIATLILPPRREVTDPGLEIVARICCITQDAGWRNTDAR